MDDDFEYESEVGSQSVEFGDELEALEILYYEGEDNRASNPDKAIEFFNNIIVDRCDSNSSREWRFRAIIQTILIETKLGRFGRTSDHLRELFSCLDSISRNEAQEGVLSVLNALSAHGCGDRAMQLHWNDLMLEALCGRGSSSQPMWLLVALRQCRLMSEDALVNAERFESLIAQIKGMCRFEDESDDVTNKGSQLLDVYAIELAFLANFPSEQARLRTREIVRRCGKASWAVCNPRSLAVIKEHSGRMLMAERRFDEAYSELFDSFKAYSDSGNEDAKRALNSAIVSNMCALSTINPFDSREAKAFQRDPVVAPVSRLREMYAARDLEGISLTIQSGTLSGLIDECMMSHLLGMTYRLKLAILTSVCQAYRKVPLDTLSKKIQSSPETTRRMVIKLILEGSIKGLLRHHVLDLDQAEHIDLQAARVTRDIAQFVKGKLAEMLDNTVPAQS